MEHVQGLGTAALADDDAVGTHAEGRPQKLPLVDAALFVEVRRAGFELDHVALLQLEFGGVLNGDDPFLLRDEAGEGVQRGRFTRTGAAGNQNGRLGLHGGRKEFQHGRHYRLVLDHFLLRDHVPAETPDAETRSVQRQGRNDRVHTGAIQQARVDNRLCLVNPAADL